MLWSRDGGCRTEVVRDLPFQRFQCVVLCAIFAVNEAERIADKDDPVHSPCVRSFVESVLTSALVSPESRLFVHVWSNVAHSRNVSPESLLSLLSIRTVHTPDIAHRLTVDPAWLMERMLEVISLPDVLDSPMETPLSLINYDKRRYVFYVVPPWVI